MTFPTKNYPGFIHRHVPAGDTDNLVTRYEGAPNANRRPYIGEPPAKGFPENPPGTTYPAGTTLIGFGEDVESKTVNRALYALHSSIDSLADRPRYVMQRVYGLLGPGGSVSKVNLADATWGVTCPSNDQLVYLGPPGTASAGAKEYVAALIKFGDDNWVPLRDNDLQLVTVIDVQDSGGLSLYPLALPGPGYFPDGKCGKVIEFDWMDGRKCRLAEEDVGGPDTDLVSLAQLCLFNYSRLARLAQNQRDQFWKAFAVVNNHVAGAGNFLTTDWDLVAAQDWQVGDVIYLTTVALTPQVEFDRVFDYSGSDICLLFGSFDRASNRDDAGTVRELVKEVSRARDLTPTIVGRMPQTPGGGPNSPYDYDGLGAMFFADLRGASLFPLGPRIKTGFVVACEEDSGAGNRHAGYGFVHLMAMEFTGDTVLGRLPINNEFQPGGGAGKIDLLGGNRWLNPGTGDTDIIIGTDMVEVYDKTGGAVGDLLGVYFIQALDPAGQIATLLTIDGRVTSSELPAANGYVRFVRPIVLDTTGIAGPSQSIPGMMTLIGTKSGGTESIPLKLINGESFWLLRGYQKTAVGTLRGVFSMRYDGLTQPTALHILAASLLDFPLFTFSAWDAEAHLEFNRRGSSAVAAYDEVDDGGPSSATKTGFAAYLHVQPVGFSRATIMDVASSGNPCTAAVPPLLVLGGGKRWGNLPDTDLFLRHDLVEFTNAVTKTTSLWTIHHFIDNVTAQLIRIDGDQSGADLVPGGTCRILRPRLHQAGNMVSVDAGTPVRIGDGLRLHVPEPVAGPPFPLSLGYSQLPGLSVYGRDWTGLLPDIGGVPVGPDKVLSVRAWASGGYYNEVIEAFADGLMKMGEVEVATDITSTGGDIIADTGDIEATAGDVRAPVGNVDGLDHRFSPTARTLYHHVNLADGILPEPNDAATNDWVYKFFYRNPQYPSPATYWSITFNAGYSADEHEDQQIIFPVHLPEGAIVTELELQYASITGVPADGAFSAQARAQLIARPVGAAPDGWQPHPGPSPYHPSVPLADPPIVEALVSVGVPALTNFQTFVGACAHVVASETRSQYYVRVRSAKNQAGGQPTEEYLYGIRIKYTMTNIRPPA